MTTLAAPPAVANTAKRRAPGAAELCLPHGYVQQDAPWTHDDLQPAEGGEYWNPARIAASARYQLHVYRWGADLIRRRGLKSVLDVGCGPGTKLASEIAPTGAAIEGVDQPSAVEAARARNSPGRYSTADLDSPGPDGAWSGRAFDLVICADVLEHLMDPAPCLEWIKRRAGERGLILLSTPDRARIRGRSCMASPKREHVREWSRLEFIRYLRSRGLDVVRSRLMPGADEPPRAGLWEDALWRLGVRETSPRSCHAVLCRVPKGG